MRNDNCRCEGRLDKARELGGCLKLDCPLAEAALAALSEPMP
jgi:hypothetical protein